MKEVEYEEQSFTELLKADKNILTLFLTLFIRMKTVFGELHLFQWYNELNSWIVFFLHLVYGVWVGRIMVTGFNQGLRKQITPLILSKMLLKI